jgi:ADP-ribose pyrophosphatase
MEREMLEIPAGKLDVPGEDRQAAARRELVEEAGLYARYLVEMGRFHNSIGFCDEETTIFLATDLEPVASEAVSVEESYLTVERVLLDDVEAMIVDGAITDAKTVIGLLQVLRRLGR